MASEAEDNRSQRRSRSRIIQACILCHRLKRKCNRKRPCSQCLNRQTSNCAYKALTAEYLESLENDTISLDVENKILQSRISQLEALISQLRNQSKDPADLRTDWKGEGPRKRTRGPKSLHRMMSLLPNQPSGLLFAFVGGTDNNKSSVSEGGSIFPTASSMNYSVNDICACFHSIARESLDAILDSFIEIVDPLHHYLPMPWILQSCSLFAVLGLGDLVAPNPTPWNFIASSFQLLGMANFLTSPSIDSIATFCFIALMGLHRDPSLISSLAPEEIEIRRRLFHTVAAQETALSVMFGRPNGLGFFDCALPQEIGNDLTNFYHYEIFYNRCTWELMEITRDLVANSFAQPKSLTLAGKKLIARQIRQWHKDIPPSLTFEPSGPSPKDLNSSFPKIARIAWMQWFRAFHAALICLVAKRARHTKFSLKIRAFNTWKSCVRIFSKIQNQNDSIQCCRRAINRLDNVVEKTANARRRLASQVNELRSPSQAVSTDSQDNYITEGLDCNYNDLSLDSAQDEIFGLDAGKWPFWFTTDQNFAERAE
ncbi:hypothetical protein POJ06DRAFT_296672 [Lipomyces tetrasporus]|uniref:Zn(2)-C6 fungal-type domain-containing protein n=1 Tax=Lipomyces tetrasporus TaxID=54092 RepID=A0AAD7QPF8_9ASCO|nr:uncharacterized protein POJ06DRAFT_296672 [Lipomyces tetrasporus]KAJ8098969.1 hypothetical protein POJ06DRAFT_296672 [Lipomyces tetrasporus]